MDNLEATQYVDKIKDSLPTSINDNQKKNNANLNFNTPSNYNEKYDTYNKGHSEISGGYNALIQGIDTTLPSSNVNIKIKKAYVPDPGLNLKVQKELEYMKNVGSHTYFDRNNLNIEKQIKFKDPLNIDNMLYGISASRNYMNNSYLLDANNKHIEKDPTKVIFDENILPRDFTFKHTDIGGPLDINDDTDSDTIDRFIDQDDLIPGFAKSKHGDHSKFAVDKENELKTFDGTNEGLKSGPELKDKIPEPAFGVNNGQSWLSSGPYSASAQPVQNASYIRR